MGNETVVLSSVSSSFAAVAHIGALRGEILILRAGGDIVAAQEGDSIFEQDIIVTADNSSALIYSQQDKVLTLGHSAKLQFTPEFTQSLEHGFEHGSLGLGRSSELDDLIDAILSGKSIQDLLGSPSAGPTIPVIAAAPPEVTPSEVEPPLQNTLYRPDIIVWQRSGNELIPVNELIIDDNNSGGGGFGDPSRPLSTEDPIDTLSSQDDSLRVAEDSGVNSGTVASNDSSSLNSELVYELVGAGVSHGALSFNSDGSYSYTPNTNYHGADSFEYRVTNSSTGDTAVQAVSINVVSAADLQAGNDSLVVAEDSGASVDTSVAGNDSTTSGGALSYTLSEGSTTANGSLSFSADGSYVYTPNDHFTGSDSFQYVVTDVTSGESAVKTVNINVTSVADLSSADDILNVSEDSGASVGSTVAGNDSTSSGGTLSYALLEGSTTSNGSLSFNPDGSYVYTPNENFNGSDSFQYIVTDATSGESATQTVSINVSAIVDLSSSDDVLDIAEDNGASAGNVAINDSTTSGDVLSYALLEGSTTANGALVFNDDGSYTYTPNDNFNGSNSFQYVVTDAASGESATQTVNINVSSVTDLTADDDILVVDEDSADNVGSVSGNDNTTSGGALTYALAEGSATTKGSLSFSADGSYTYTPTMGVSGADSFQYVVTDANSGESSTQTVSITITPANTPPEGTDSSATIDEDNSYIVLVADFGFSDVVEGDTFTGVRIDTLPLLGTLTLSGIAVTAGQIIAVTSIAANDLLFTPAADGNGTPYASFTFSVQDSAGSIDEIPNTFTINVNPISDNPIAADDTYDVIVNTPFSTTLANGVLLNDSDGDGDVLTVNTTPIVNATGGVLIINADGTFTYTPNLDFNGSDSFTYEIDDGTGNTTQATANITVDYVSDTLIGDNSGDNLVGTALSDDDIYSGGVEAGALVENIQGVGGTISEAQANHVGSGNDRLIFDGDDAFVTDAGNGVGHIRIRDFTTGDVTVDTDADTLVLGDFLRAGDPGFDGTAADAVRFLHFVDAGGSKEGELLYIDRDGGLGAADDAARNLSSGIYGGVDGGASLFLEFKGIAYDASPLDETLNTIAHIQNLMDIGFLDFS